MKILPSKITTKSLLILILFAFISPSFAQINISGSVKDNNDGSPLVGVNIIVKGKLSGTITDLSGNFNLSTGETPPFTLVFSYIGFAKQEIEITTQTANLEVVLEEQSIYGEEVVIAASRFEENIMQSPVTIEKMDLIDIQESAAVDFYDGVGNLKGVDLNRQSFTFKVPNTRGFNGNTNYRMNQIVDGLDNSPPGLNFAAGNIFGVNQLDIENVELLVGASSALYGPGGMNGTLIMNSKSPFQYQGLSVYAQTGVMHVGADYVDNPELMYDLNFRYAKAFNDKIAFKVTGGYISALDWNAVDFRDFNDLNDPTLTRESNPGYDGVNVYGDDVIVPVNLAALAPTIGAAAAESQGFLPGTPEYDATIQTFIDAFPDQIVTRTGYEEEHLVNYDTRNVRLNGSFHYRINEDMELNVAGGYGNGTAVYTAQNRFSLTNFEIYQEKIELKGSNFFARIWGVQERGGDAYDAGAAAQLINEAWKPSAQWYADYIEAFTVQKLFFQNPDNVSHRFARQVADNRGPGGNILRPGEPTRPLPGTVEFETLLDQMRLTPIDQGGAKVIDKNDMYTVEGMYNFGNKIPFADILVGFSHRIFKINSEGTIWFDEPGNPVFQHQFGAYTQLTRRFIDNKLKLTISARYDKNEKFESRATPRGSFVYSFGENRQSNFRGSIQTAFRFPPLSDQWIDLNVGPFQVVGGLPEVQAQYNFDSNPVYPLIGTNPLNSFPDTIGGPFVIPKYRPERVTALELGYKGTFFNGKMLVDAYGYLNQFNGFLATQNLVQNPGDSAETRYQTFVSTSGDVKSFGWAIGADYRLRKGYTLRGNIAFNKLESDLDQSSGIETRFNSPDYRLNVSLANLNAYKNLGFSISWRWQNEFLWESTFGVADIPSYNTLDAFISYKWTKRKSIIKVGGSNLLNEGYTTGFGNPEIGGLYYVSIVFDQFMN